MITGGLAGLKLFLPVAFTWPGIALMVSAILALKLLSDAAAGYCSQIVEYLDDNKSEIICALYTSGSAAQALEAIAAIVEDAIQAIEWGPVLGPLAPELTPLLAGIFSQVQNNGTVNVLFNLTADIVLLGETCPCQTEAWFWHFTAGVEGWGYWNEGGEETVWTHGWTAATEGADPNDVDPGRLWVGVNKASNEGPGSSGYRYTWAVDRPVASEGMTFSVHGLIDNPGHSSFYTYIVYTDNTYDDDISGNPSGWQEHTAVVSQANVGKTVLFLGWHFDVGSLLDQVYGYVDHASFA
jgi:hypothetical protein